MTTIVGSPVTTPSGAAADCITYATIAQIQSAYGEDVADWTDGQIQLRIDQMASELEDQLGHTFGRAVMATSTTTDTVQVTALGVVIGGDTYLFADYATLGALVAAVNLAGESYSLELLPQINPSTPSTLLSVAGAATCGPDYEDRVILCISDLWIQTSGGGSKVFLPLPIYSMTTVEENGTEVTSSYMWALAGETWITRKCCACSNSCVHPAGRWSMRYPGNIEITYVPVAWGKPPASLKSALVQAFGMRWNVGDENIKSESFGGAYSYTKSSGGTTSAQSWTDVLGGATIRRWAIQYQP